MNKFIFVLGAAVLGLVFAGNASAHEPHGRPVQRGLVVVARPYHLEHGTRFNGGYIYRGDNHHHWEYRVWNTRYNRYQYWDPTLRSYYYWNPAQVAYYPCD